MKIPRLRFFPLSRSLRLNLLERGVEDETLSCGTGVTAVALAMYEQKKTTSNEVTLQTMGGALRVSFAKTKSGFENVKLIGPAVQVFKGDWEW